MNYLLDRQVENDQLWCLAVWERARSHELMKNIKGLLFAPERWSPAKHSDIKAIFNIHLPSRGPQRDGLPCLTVNALRKNGRQALDVVRTKPPVSTAPRDGTENPLRHHVYFRPVVIKLRQLV
jgi:hypothetical protein